MSRDMNTQFRVSDPLNHTLWLATYSRLYITLPNIVSHLVKQLMEHISPNVC